MSSQRHCFKKLKPEEKSTKPSSAYLRLTKATKFGRKFFYKPQDVATNLHEENFFHQAQIGDAFDREVSAPAENENNPQPLQDYKLYYGCSFTQTEAMKDVLSMFRAHNVSNILRDEILQLLDKYLPPLHCMPTSWKALLKLVMPRDTPLVRNFYCDVHAEYLGKETDRQECLDCQNGHASDPSANQTMFFSLELKTVLSRLISDPVVTRLINRKLPSGFLDIKHGRRYLEITRNRGESSLTLMFWYDGTDLKGKSNSLWVLLWTLLELPIQCRWDMARYAVVCCSNKKPSAQVILAPFVEESKTLTRQQLHNEESTVIYRTGILCCICDAPARCDGRGNRQYNSLMYGCTTCLFCAKDGNYAFQHGDQLDVRTHEQTLRDAQELVKIRQAAQTPKEIKAAEVGPRGINNFSELLRYGKDCFDIIRCVPHDLMHIISNLGHHLFQLLRSSEMHGMQFAALHPAYAAGRTSFLNARELKLIETAMEGIRFPSAYNRIPRRNPKDWSDYKSSEYMYFFLIVVPFLFQKRGDAVDEVLHPEVRKLLLTLSYTLHHLLCDRYDPGLLPSDVIQKRATVAQRLANDFVHQSTKLFGSTKITYAFHQLQHVPENYRDFGPAYAWSTFGWESLIGVSKRMQHGTNKALQEITNKVVHDEAIRNYLSCSRNLNEVQMLGAALSESALTAAEVESLSQSILKDKISRENCVINVHKRMTFRNGIKAESRENERGSGRSDAFFRMTNCQIISLTSFAHVRTAHRSFYYAIGNLLSGPNTRLHIPVVWKELGASGSQPLTLDVPIQYRGFPPPVIETCVAVPLQQLDWPLFVLESENLCVAQYLLPSLTVMPKD